MNTILKLGVGVPSTPLASFSITRTDPRSSEHLGQIPSIRSCPSWCKEGDSVYVFGGYDGDDAKQRSQITPDFTGVQRMNDLFACNLDTHT